MISASDEEIAAHAELTLSVVPPGEALALAERLGFVRRNAHGVWAMLESGHEQPVPISQQLARSDDVCAVPAVAARNVEDLLAGRGIDISHETVRFWWNRFGPMFAAEIRKKRVAHLRSFPQWRWHLDEVFVKINGKFCYLWRAVDHEGEVLETVVTRSGTGLRRSSF
jgi:hypothetical protein